MTPAVAETAQVRRAAALVFPKRYGNFASLGTDLRGLDHKFRGELHAAAAQIHALEDVARKSAHPAMRIADAGAEEHVEHHGEAGISEVFVVPRHGARLDFSCEAVAHDHFAAPAPLFDEAGDFAEVVAVVGVTHDDEGATGRTNAGFQRRSVTSLRDGNHARSGCLGNFDGAVGRSVIGYD